MEKISSIIAAALLSVVLIGCEGESGSIDGNGVPSIELNDTVVMSNFGSTTIPYTASSGLDEEDPVVTLSNVVTIGTASVDSTNNQILYSASQSQTDYFDSIVIEVTNSEGDIATASVAFYVGNSAPTMSASASSIEIDAGDNTSLTLSVSDINTNDSHTWSASLENELNGSSVSVTPSQNNTAILTYVAGDAGVDTITVTVTDSAGASSTSDILVVVASVDIPNATPSPFVTGSTLSVVEGNSINVQVFDGDTDATDTHTYSVSTSPSFGTASVSSSGLVSYTGQSAGSDSLVITVTDNLGASGTVTISITVEAEVVTPVGGNAANGETLVGEASCATCHGASLDLLNIRAGSDVDFLKNAVNTSASMISVKNRNFSDQDFEDIAAYLDTL